MSQYIMLGQAVSHDIIVFCDWSCCASLQHHQVLLHSLGLFLCEVIDEGAGYRTRTLIFTGDFAVALVGSCYCSDYVRSA